MFNPTGHCHNDILAGFGHVRWSILTTSGSCNLMPTPNRRLKMRDKLADYEWATIEPMLPEQAAWRSSG